MDGPSRRNQFLSVSTYGSHGIHTHEKHTGEEGRLLVRLDHKEFSLDVAGCENGV